MIHLVLWVIEPGETADRILARVARALHRDSLPAPDESGRFDLFEDDVSAWQIVHDALWADEANDGELIVRLETPRPLSLAE